MRAIGILLLIKPYAEEPEILHGSLHNQLEIG